MNLPTPEHVQLTAEIRYVFHLIVDGASLLIHSIRQTTRRVSSAKDPIVVDNIS